MSSAAAPWDASSSRQCGGRHNEPFVNFHAEFPLLLHPRSRWSRRTRVGPQVPSRERRASMQSVRLQRPCQARDGHATKIYSLERAVVAFATAVIRQLLQRTRQGHAPSVCRDRNGNRCSQRPIAISEAVRHSHVAPACVSPHDTLSPTTRARLTHFKLGCESASDHPTAARRSATPLGLRSESPRRERKEARSVSARAPDASDLSAEERLAMRRRASVDLLPGCAHLLCIDFRQIR